MFLVPITRNSSEIARSLNRLFDESFERMFSPTSTAPAEAARSPALDVAESERAYTVTLEMPGVTKSDVKVSIDGHRIDVQARSAETDEKGDGDRIIYRERTEASYARSFTLPTEVDQSESSAKFDNGVLKLELTKRRASTAAQLSIN